MKQLFKKSNIALLFVIAFTFLFTPSIVRIEATVLIMADQVLDDGSGGGGGGTDGTGGGGGGGSTGSVTLTAGIDKTEYLPGSTISASASSMVNTCSNVTSSILVTGTVIDVSGTPIDKDKTIIPRQNVTGGTFLAGNSNFTAPSKPGWYFVQFKAYRYASSTSTSPISEATMNVSFVVIDSQEPLLSLKVFAERTNLTPIPMSNPLNLYGKGNNVRLVVRPSKDVTKCWCTSPECTTSETNPGPGGITDSYIVVETINNVDTTKTFDVSCSTENITTPPPVTGTDKVCIYNTSVSYNELANQMGKGSTDSQTVTTLTSSLASCLSSVVSFCNQGIINTYNDGTNAWCDYLYIEQDYTYGTSNFISYDGILPPDNATSAPIVAPSCYDGILNQDETGIDTGGICGNTTPTCYDGILNQNETGIDTGGVCGVFTPPCDPETEDCLMTAV